jgi:transposase
MPEASLLSLLARAWLVPLYLPPYSPHLNLAEVLWRKLKYEWLRPEDYFQAETLFYSGAPNLGITYMSEAFS